MIQENTSFGTLAAGEVDCLMPAILNQNYSGNPQGVRNTGCALCCDINLASFKKGKKYTLADFAGHYTEGSSNNSAYVYYNWTAPDGVAFTSAISLASMTEAKTIQRIRDYVNKGIPVACHAVGGGNEHWFVAYHADDNGGNTWETSGLYVLDPYNGDGSSYYGRTVSIVDAMSTSSVKAGIDRIRLLV